MEDQERLFKNKLCDRLIAEGIDGKQDAAAVASVCALADLTAQLGRQDGRPCLLAWYEALDKRNVRGEQAILLDYNRANVIAHARYGTKWQWEQTTLAGEIFYLRRAISNEKFSQISEVMRCMCLNNLGNRLRVAGRLIEALDCWRRVLEVQPRFGMSLCNRARGFFNYAETFEDEDLRALFLWIAHREAAAAVAAAAIYTDVRDEPNRGLAAGLKEWVESFMDVAGIAALDPLSNKESSGSEVERDYRRWCLANYLYLNPINDAGPCTLAATDSQGLAGHVVRVDAPHTYESFYEQMKQEFVSARWMLYEGLTAKTPHFSDRDVLLKATDPRPSLCLAVEKVKTAYKTSYSLFDKVGFFINAYMGLGIPEKQVSFRTLWRAGENKPIRQEFDLTGNWGFCALYWLARDFFEKEHDEVAEPQARRLSEIRNHIEHKYLRVTATGSPSIPPDDLAMSVSREHFEAKALHILKLARTALIYLAIGVRFEEQKREPSRAGIVLEEIPLPPLFTDAEKV